MSAETTLRKAAALMRERAQAATGATYHWRTGRIGRHQRGLVACGNVQIAVTDERIGQPLCNADHIASWHPAVALAVADWLDLTAADLEWYLDFGERLKAHARATGKPEPEGDPTQSREVQSALAVARAYLGGA